MDASVMEADHVPLDLQLLLKVALKLAVNVLQHCSAAISVRVCTNERLLT